MLMASEKRKEERYRIAIEAFVERKTGERIVAYTLNVSGSGVLLALRSSKLQIGEEVRCGIKMYDGKPPQSLGAGRVVRVDDASVAIDFEPTEAKRSEPSTAITL